MSEKKYLALRDLDAYRHALSLSNDIWSVVQKWDYFARDTVGKQLVRSVDSVSANIAEGFGRYYKKDKILFYRYAYGSVQESMDWILKAYLRKLVSEEDYKEILRRLKELPEALHCLIKFTDEKLKQ